MNCSKASPTVELVTELNMWDLHAALACRGYPIGTFTLLPDFFDWLQREVRSASLPAVLPIRVPDRLRRYSSVNQVNGASSNAC